MFFFIFLFSLWSQAGTWGSSGGELFKDANNPWFLKNTSSVNYCIEIDQEGVSLEKTAVHELIKLAIDYWKEELKGKGESLGLGTQKFVFNNSCSGEEDIKFQFGYNTLTEEQLEFFKKYGEKPQNYLGLALKTQYDRVNLKAKGFVFISSDKGEDNYNYGKPQSRRFEESLWSHKGILFRLLQHEIGHVFGIHHTQNSFMSSEFPANLLKNFRQFRDLKSAQKNHFFELRTNRNISCDDFFFKEIKKEYNLDKTIKCSYLNTKDNWLTLEIFLSDEDHLEKFLLGTGVKGKIVSVELEFPIKVFLPEGQKVFLDRDYGNFLNGPSRKKITRIFSFEEKNKKKYSILLRFSPDSLELYFGRGGKFEKVY